MTEPEKDEKKDNKQKRIRTVYSNIVRIGHSPYEFMLDFGQFQPEGKRAFMDVRIIVSPQHAKAILKALNENIGGFEEKHGKIGASPSDAPEEDTDSEWRSRRK
jgi:uncharacterized protein DUF3467